MENFVQTNKLILLGKLTASLVHEIRNPLSAIKLNLDYMSMAQDDLPEDIREIVGESLDAFEQVNFLIEDILDFTRRPTTKLHQVNLDTITDRCLKIISVSARLKGLTIEKEIETDLPLLNVNKNKLMQIFLNLLNNAVEASSEKGRVIIRAYSRNDQDCRSAVWEVQDFGSGIKDEDKEKILGDYYTTKTQGHGIGLSVCKMLTDELKSELTFSSLVGQGSTFTVRFKENCIITQG